MQPIEREEIDARVSLMIYKETPPTSNLFIGIAMNGNLLLLIFMCFRNYVSDGQIEEHQDMRGSVQQYFECA